MPDLRTKTAILVLAAAAMLPNLAQADCISAQPIYAHNNTSQPIWVAAKYIPAGSNCFVDAGWWRVEPGQCLLIAYNGGRWIYFNAYDNQGHKWEGNDTTGVVRGQTLNMFRMDTGMCFDPWTVDFNPTTAH